MLRFWQNVKDELEYNLITQKELASKIKISYNTLQSWITKDRLPNAEEALKIANVLNTSIEFLVTGKHPQQKEMTAHLQNFIKKISQLSDENITLLSTIADRLK